MLFYIRREKMPVVERILRSNCSEWDERVEADYDKEADEMLYPEIEEIKEQIEKGNWDK